MSNGWVVPFSEKIDWSRAALIWDERLLIEFKDYIAEIDQETISRMRQQAAWYYRAGLNLNTALPQFGTIETPNSGLFYENSDAK